MPIRCETIEKKVIDIQDTGNVLEHLCSKLSPAELDHPNIMTAVNNNDIALLVSYFKLAELEALGISFNEIQKEKSLVPSLTPNMGKQQPSSEEKTKHILDDDSDHLKNPSSPEARIKIRIW